QMPDTDGARLYTAAVTFTFCGASPSKRDCASPDLDHVAADADAALFIHFQIEQRRPPRLLSLLDLEPAGKLAPQGKTPAAEICGRRAGRRVFEDGRSLRKEESREQ